MRNIIITVLGTQTDADSEESRIELTSVGTCHEKNGVYYITYRESEVSGLEGTTTVLKLFPDKVTLVRMGALEQKQEFCPGEKRYCTYITPYGSMKMCATTRRLDMAIKDGLGTVDIEYDLEIDGQWQSYNTLSVRIREDELR